MNTSKHIKKQFLRDEFKNLCKIVIKSLHQQSFYLFMSQIFDLIIFSLSHIETKFLIQNDQKISYRLSCHLSIANLSNDNIFGFSKEFFFEWFYIFFSLFLIGLSLKNIISKLINSFSLLVHYTIIVKQVLSYSKIPSFNFLLRSCNRLSKLALSKFEIF